MLLSTKEIQFSFSEIFLLATFSYMLYFSRIDFRLGYSSIHSLLMFWFDFHQT